MYGFKSEHCPPQRKALTLFENDMYDFAKNIKFRKTGNEFQQQNANVKSIKESKSFYVRQTKLLISIKSSRMTTTSCLMITSQQFIQKQMKLQKSINKEAQAIAYKLDLYHRI